MTPELLAWLIPGVAALAGWWVRNWTGPLATFLRRFVPTPSPAPSPDGAPAPLIPGLPSELVEALNRLIPNDPNAVWDDIARQLLTAILGGKAPDVEKLGLIERLLAAVKDRIVPVKP